MSRRALRLEDHLAEAALENADFLEYECGEDLDLVCLRLGVSRDQIEMGRRRRAAEHSNPHPVT